MSTLTYTATQAQASKYDPTLRQINQSQDTVAGQMEGLLSKDNDYMKRAETRANHQMNSRGLLNSSMAVGASQAAAIDAALPIAQQDASTYFQQGRDNQNYTNQAAQWNAGNETQVSMVNADADNRFKLADQGYQHNRGLQEQQFGHQTKLATQQYQHQRGLASLDGDIRSRLMTQEGQIQTALANLGHGHNMELEKLKQANLKTMNDDSNAANIYMKGLEAIGVALSNGNTNREQQNAMVSSIVGNMRAGIEFVSSIKGGALPRPSQAGAVSGAGVVPHYNPASPGGVGNSAPLPAPAPAPAPAKKTSVISKAEHRARLAAAYKKRMARNSQNKR